MVEQKAGDDQKTTDDQKAGDEQTTRPWQEENARADQEEGIVIKFLTRLDYYKNKYR